MVVVILEGLFGKWFHNTCEIILVDVVEASELKSELNVLLFNFVVVVESHAILVFAGVILCFPRISAFFPRYIALVNLVEPVARPADPVVRQNERDASPKLESRSERKLLNGGHPVPPCNVAQCLASVAEKEMVVQFEVADDSQKYFAFKIIKDRRNTLNKGRR